MYLCHRPGPPQACLGGSGVFLTAPRLMDQPSLRSARVPGVQASPSLLPPRGAVARAPPTNALPLASCSAGSPGLRAVSHSLTSQPRPFGLLGDSGQQWGAGSLQYLVHLGRARHPCLCPPQAVCGRALLAQLCRARDQLRNALVAEQSSPGRERHRTAVCGHCCLAGTAWKEGTAPLPVGARRCPHTHSQPTSCFPRTSGGPATCC